MTSPASLFSLQGKSVFVRGATSAVGKAVAAACAQRGARVLESDGEGRVDGLVYCEEPVPSRGLLSGTAIATNGSVVFVQFPESLIGLQPMVKTLALDVAMQKIRVNSIAPSASVMETPEDIANAVVYLLSDASRWVTGTSLVINGETVGR